MQNKYGRIFHDMLSALISGALIGLGGMSYLSCEDNEYLGALLFSYGLITVLLLKTNLFTGKVGFIGKASDIPKLLMMCLFNFCGAAIIGLISYGRKEYASYIVMGKINNTIWHSLLYSILCGILIHLAVELYDMSHSIILIIIPVMIFILTGCEHCVANVFYIVCSRQFHPECILFILVCIVGNSIGAIGIKSLIQLITFESMI